MNNYQFGNAFDFENSEKHLCAFNEQQKQALYGIAVSDILFSKVLQSWVMHNEEYASYPIIACPFCGKKL